MLFLVEIYYIYFPIKVDFVTLYFFHTFSDEADLLSDRVCILSNGKLQCAGSPMFLKRIFNTSYVLSVFATFALLVLSDCMELLLF